MPQTLSDARSRPSVERLLSTESVNSVDSTEMQRLTSRDAYAPDNKNAQQSQPREEGENLELTQTTTSSEEPQSDVHYRVYKRRFFGLVQLVLLNIVVSWDWLTFSAVSTTTSQYFDVSPAAINWLSTGFLFAFVVVSPLVVWTINKHGVKASIVAASAMILVGNWIRYGGSRASGGSFGVVMFGQILIGFAQPFVLAAPTRYSNLWFSDKGRVTATAIASLANPFGGALGQLIGPLWANDTAGIPDMVLYTSIISTIAALPAFFIPKAPPSPPSAIAAEEKLDIRHALQVLPRNISFYLVILPFSVYVGLFNAVSSLLNQILEPYGFTETEAGISGGILIIVGLIASAIISPVIDRTKVYLLTIKILVPLIAIGYLILIWAPQTRTVAAPFVVCGLLGASSFSLLPCVLEYLVIITHPVSPELTSTMAWTGGQLLGGIFIVSMTALKGVGEGEPDGSMKQALIFQAVLAWVVVPLPMCLGLKWLEKGRSVRLAEGV